MNGNNFINNPASYGFRYCNIEFLNNSNNYQYTFYFACLYDHFPIFVIVELWLITRRLNWMISLYNLYPHITDFNLSI